MSVYCSWFWSVDRSLERVCEVFKPTVLIGASGQPGAFTETIIRMVSANVDRPVILPLSNPTEQSEVFPVDAFAWSGGKALVAAGSPFDDVSVDGRIYRVGQGNNAFIFPGIGLGVIIAKAKKVTDSMFYAAAKALANEVTHDELASGLLFPTIDRLTEVSSSVAHAVILDAIENGLAEPLTAAEIEQHLKDGRWFPDYPQYEISHDD